MDENKKNIEKDEEMKQIFFDIIEGKANNITRENANMDTAIPAGMMMKFGAETSKKFVDEYLLSEEARKACDEGYIHIHAKDYYPTKSLAGLQCPLDKLLKEGFRAGYLFSRPAKRIETAGILSFLALQTIQNEMHGGQSIPAFDFYLAPYVRKTYIEEINKVADFIGKDLIHLYNYEINDYTVKAVDELKDDEKYVQEAINNTVKRVHQAMEAFIQNLNTVRSRGGNQVVFSSINYGTDTSAEGRCIIREILLTTERGVGNNETPIFPIQIWKKKRGVNYLPGDRNYDLYKYACSVTIKRFFPNYINLDVTFNQNEKWNNEDPERYKYECAIKGCRTRVFEDIFGDKTSVGRGNLSSTTLNLPKIAIESAYEAQEQTGVKFEIGRDSEQNMTEEYKEAVKNIFMKKMEQYASVVARQLVDRYRFQCTANPKQFPLVMSGLWEESEKLEKGNNLENALKHGTLAIGFIGLAEALTALTGKHHGESEIAQNLGVEIIQKLNELAENFSKQYNLNFNVIATAAESLAGEFTKMDQEKYGKIVGVTDKEYYTNSNHVPVWYKCSAEHKAKIEAPYHKLTKGGNFFYIELDNNALSSPESIETVVDLMDKYDIGYGSVNHVRVRCRDCGFEKQGVKFSYCPVCDSENIDTIQRIAGYLVGTTARWNSAKLAELKDRVTHALEEE